MFLFAAALAAGKLGLQVVEAMGAGAIGGFITSNAGMALGALNNLSTTRAVNAAYNTGNAKLIGLAQKVHDQMKQGKQPDIYDTARLKAALGYYDSLNEAQKLAYDLEPAVLEGTATLAEQMAYKIATGEKLTIAEMNRLDRDHDAIVQLGKMLGTRVANLNYTELAATLNSTATKNAKGNENLSQLQEQYQQQVERIETAREQERQSKVQRQREQKAQESMDTAANISNISMRGLKKSPLDSTMNKRLVQMKINESGKVVNPMDSSRYNRMRKGIEKHGYSVVSATEGDDYRFLLWFGAEAIADKFGIMHIGEVPSASAFFEEIIHLSQIRRFGEVNNDDYVERAAREVAANRKLLRNASVYGFTEEDYNDIEKI